MELKVKQNNNWRGMRGLRKKCIRCNNNNFEKYKTNEKSKDLNLYKL
jgi:hypothetical protein